MSRNPAKDFDEIAGDYAFFEQHATQAEQDARAYQAHLASIKPADGTVDILDFGCGTGTFTARLLELTGWTPQRLRLTLVETAESARRQAVERLARFSTSPLMESAALPVPVERRFDVVLANHVFYYVPDLQRTLGRLIAALAPAGVFLTAVAARTNALCELSVTGFRQLAREMPYQASEDVELALRTLNAHYEKRHVPYKLSFPDSTENRTRILRFMLADHLAQMPRRPLLEWFDQFSDAGRIDIETESDHYTVRP
ncbi:MAG TPA: class I SAM-dependent methyltransferase [Mycobacterium sp.]|nr:class I SAM-dependent methyltransferase [Mycobacterium sp.]HTX94590.1 class I SAM-dependent methyltransferase [Mycobacterium sp.]